MKKNVILLILVSLIPIGLFSQAIIKKSGSGYCDCYEGEGESLRMEKFDLLWNDNDLPNGKWEDETYKWHWNTLVKEYYCGCNIGNNCKSILKEKKYWRNGKKHGVWHEYFESTNLKTVTRFAKDSLLTKTRYSEDGTLYDGKYEGVKFNYAHQKNMIMYIEQYRNGNLIHGIYYKDEGSLCNSKNEELEIDFIYKKY